VWCGRGTKGDGTGDTETQRGTRENVKRGTGPRRGDGDNSVVSDPLSSRSPCLCVSCSVFLFSMEV
jgi:hypothetical protein